MDDMDLLMRAESYRLAGYAAAQAAMPPRAPTQAMIAAAVSATGDAPDDVRIMARVIWRAMHDAWTQEQTGRKGNKADHAAVGATAGQLDPTQGDFAEYLAPDHQSATARAWPFQRPPAAVAASLYDALAAFDGNMLAAVRNVFIENGEPLTAQAATDGPAVDPQNGVQRDAASPGCALGASSLESGNAREATCLSGGRDGRRGTPTQQGQLGAHAGSTPAPPTDHQPPYKTNRIGVCWNCGDALTAGHSCDAFPPAATSANFFDGPSQEGACDPAADPSPVDYRYLFTDPITRVPIWRHESREWNGQHPVRSEPLYSAAELERLRAERDEQHAMAVERWDKMVAADERAERAEAERDTLAAIVLAADAMHLRPTMDNIKAWADARAKWEDK